MIQTVPNRYFYHKSKMILNAWPYQKNLLDLPVKDVGSAFSFYETYLGFVKVTEDFLPIPSVTLSRDSITIRLAENGGDPEQDGCFFEVENVEVAYEELKARGLKKGLSDSISFTKHGDAPWRVFFVVAPDGLCFCYGQKA